MIKYYFILSPFVLQLLSAIAPVQARFWAIEFEDLEQVFLSGNLGIQYAFMSSKAIKSLKFQKAIECEEEYVGHYYSLVSEANRQFDVLISKPRDPNKTYILDLMRQDHEH